MTKSTDHVCCLRCCVPLMCSECTCQPEKSVGSDETEMKVILQWNSEPGGELKDLVLRTEAFQRLSNKEAEIRQLKRLLVEYLDIRDEAASIDDVLPDQSDKAWIRLIERQNTLTTLVRSLLKS